MIKKITALLLTLAIIFVALPFNFSINATAASGMNIWSGDVATAFAGGTGTEQDPYLISNGEQLALLAYNVNNGNDYTDTYFLLNKDIYLNDIFYNFTDDETANAKQWMPIGGHKITGEPNLSNEFCGVFDGGNHKVYGLYINKSIDSYGDYLGLFGYSHYGIIKNTSVLGSYIVGYNYIGGIIGFNYGEIYNCSFSGKILSNDYGAGGIAGRSATIISNCNNSGTIIGCYFIGGIIGDFIAEYNRYSSSPYVSNCYNTGSIIAIKKDNGGKYAGGIVGRLYALRRSARVIECFNIGQIVCTESEAGGIVGWSTGYDGSCIIFSSYNTGYISAPSNAGGIVGKFSLPLAEFNRVSCCYDVGNVNGTGSKLYGMAETSHYSGVYYSYQKATDNGYLNRTDDKMQSLSNYTDWDFENVWEFDYSNGYIYPQLKNLPHISASKRYFSDEEAKLFFSFIFDCSKTDDTLIEESSLYKYMTGRLTTAEEKENARVALLTLVYSCLDSCIEDAEYSLESSESGIMEYLSSKVSDNAEEDVANEIVGGILKDIQKGIGATAVAQLSNTDFDYVMENAGIINSALSLKGVAKKGKEYAEKLKTLAASYIYADSIETLNMYKYFSSYINARKNFSSADDENFRLLMDTYQLVLEDSQALAPLASIISGKSIIDLVLNFFTGKSSDWTKAEHIALLERWAEFIYQTSELVKQKSEALQNGEEELYKPHFTVNLNGTIAIAYGSNISTLNVKAEADTNSDIIYKWYINDTASTAGGKMVGSGSYYKPSGLACGTHYLYAVAENRNGYGISEDITTVSGIKKIIVDHSYTATVKSPTCLDGGYTNYDCKGCTKAYTDNYTNALGHSYSSDWTTDIEPTCTSVGSQSHHCIRCEDKKDITEIAMTEHSLGEWITDREATLTEEGEKHKNCLACGGDFSYEAIPLRILGDLSYDMLINSLDVTTARKALLNALVLSDIELAVADINEDSYFDIRDIVKYKKVLSN